MKMILPLDGKLKIDGKALARKILDKFKDARDPSCSCRLIKSNGYIDNYSTVTNPM